MSYDERKRIVERGDKIAQAIVHAHAVTRAKEALVAARVPEEFWR